MKMPAKRNPKDIPSGQPRPYPRVHRWQAKDGRKLARFMYPHEVVNIRKKDDLTEALEHYSHPAPMMNGSPTPKNEHARRYLIEWIFPALRWYCNVYSVPVPRWLKGNGWADGMSDADSKRFFGPGPLDVKEWREDREEAGVRA